MSAVTLHRLDAASVKLEHAVAMADVLHDVAFKDLTDDTLQAYVHGLREQIVAAMALMNETNPATKSNDAALEHSSTGHVDLARAALNATFEISSLATAFVQRAAATVRDRMRASSFGVTRAASRSSATR